MLLAKNYQSRPMFRGIIKKTKSGTFFIEIQCSLSAFSQSLFFCMIGDFAENMF